jgi:hypothetical protein
MNHMTIASKTKTRSYVLWLILWSLLIRTIIYVLLPPSEDFGRYANSGTLYFSALTEHFADYLSFTTNIPPATFIIESWIVKWLGGGTAMDTRAFLILIFLLDTAALLLLFYSCKKLAAGQKFSFGLLCLFSAALVPFELWRDGMHYDHFTFFFTSFFAWSLVRFIKDQTGSGNLLWISLSGALLVSQSAVNAAIVPFSILVIVGYLYGSKKQWLQMVYGLVLTLMLPVFVLALISRKNQKEGQESLTSNKAGPAMIMVVQRAYQYDVNKVRDLMKESGAPDWYIWTYDHATPPIDSATGKEAEGWMNLAQAFGVCFYSQSNTGKGPWQFDFDPLIHYLEQNGPQHLLPIVKADAMDAVERPYRFAGFAPELSPRWIGVYGEISKKIFFSAMRKNPFGMLRAFIAQQGIFAIYGPLFPYNTTQEKPSLLARSGLRTEKKKMPLQGLFIIATLVFAFVAWVTYIVMLANIPLTILRSVKAMKSGGKKQVNAFLLLSVPAICIAIVFSCLVGGENDRYFIQLTPYLILLTSGLPVWFSNLKEKVA